jgi:hypothetical protein
VLLQFINRVPSPGPAAAPPVQGAPTVALHGCSTVCPSLTMQQMQVQHDCMERWLQQAKTVIRNLRKDVVEAHRCSNEQNERLLRIELFMENLSDNFLDDTKM